MFPVDLSVFSKDDRKAYSLPNSSLRGPNLEQLVYPVVLSVLMKDNQKAYSLSHSSLRRLNLEQLVYPVDLSHTCLFYIPSWSFSCPEIAYTKYLFVLQAAPYILKIPKAPTKREKVSEGLLG